MLKMKFNICNLNSNISCKLYLKELPIFSSFDMKLFLRLKAFLKAVSFFDRASKHFQT